MAHARHDSARPVQSRRGIIPADHPTLFVRPLGGQPVYLRKRVVAREAGYVLSRKRMGDFACDQLAVSKALICSFHRLVFTKRDIFHYHACGTQIQTCVTLVC